MTRYATLLVLLLAGCATIGPLPDDEAAIRRVIADFARHWRALDGDGVMAMLTDDVVLMPHHGDPPIESAAEVRRYWFPGGASTVTIDRYAFDPREIEIECNLAYARGFFELAFSFGGGGGGRESNGNFLMVLRREADGWKIARYIWNDPPPELADAITAANTDGPSGPGPRNPTADSLGGRWISRTGTWPGRGDTAVVR